PSSTTTPSTPGGRKAAGPTAAGGTAAPTTRARWPKACGSSPRRTRTRRSAVASSTPVTWSTSAPTPLDAEVTPRSPDRVAAVTRRSVVLLTAVTLALGGCGGSPKRESSPPQTVRPSDLVAVEGPAPVGRFYAKA